MLSDSGMPVDIYQALFSMAQGHKYRAPGEDQIFYSCCSLWDEF